MAVTFGVEVALRVISVGLEVAAVGVVLLSQRLPLWLKEHTFSDVAPNLDLHSFSTLSLPSPQHFEHGKQTPLSSKYLSNNRRQPVVTLIANTNE